MKSKIGEGPRREFPGYFLSSFGRRRRKTGVALKLGEDMGWTRPTESSWESQEERAAKAAYEERMKANKVAFDATIAKFDATVGQLLANGWVQPDPYMKVQCQSGTGKKRTWIEVVLGGVDPRAHYGQNMRGGVRVRRTQNSATGRKTDWVLLTKDGRFTAVILSWPGNDWECASPQTPDAAELTVDQVDWLKT